MTSKARSLVADLLVLVAVAVLAIWLVRRFLGAIAWVGGLIVLAAVVGGLLWLARKVRRGGG